MHHPDFDQHVLCAKDKMFRFALRLLGNTDDARDAVQDALTKIWEQRERLKEVKNAEAWSMQVTKNLCLDRLKAAKIRKMATPELERMQGIAKAAMPYQLTEQQNLLREVKNMIAALPEKYKMAIHLRDIEGFSYQEMAEILQWSMEEVKVNLFRARKHLKEKCVQSKVYGRLS